MQVNKIRFTHDRPEQFPHPFRQRARSCLPRQILMMRDDWGRVSICVAISRKTLTGGAFHSVQNSGNFPRNQMELTISVRSNRNLWDHTFDRSFHFRSVGPKFPSPFDKCCPQYRSFVSHFQEQ